MMTAAGQGLATCAFGMTPHSTLSFDAVEIQGRITGSDLSVFIALSVAACRMTYQRSRWVVSTSAFQSKRVGGGLENSPDLSGVGRSSLARSKVPDRGQTSD